MLAIAAISLAIWLYLIFGRGGFWRLSANDEPQPAAARVRAVVPARDEAENVGRTVSSLLRQEIVDLRIVLVDDSSSDGTAQAAQAAADAIGAGQSLTVISGSPVPQGWTGKMWAVQQGIERALAEGPDFILLTDADIEHGPRTVAGLAGRAARGFDLVSYMVKLRCESLAERLLIPAFVYFFFQLYPPKWIAEPRAQTAGSAGGCILIRPEALARAGGIAAIRGEIIDDCALARAVKRSGGRLWLGPTGESTSLRAYGSFGEIGRMIARTAFNQLRHSSWLLVTTIIALLLTFAAPVASVASGRESAMLLGGAAWAVMTVTYLPMVRFYGLNPLWSLTLPVAATFYAGATIWSAVRYWTGRGGEWKGRAQDVVIE